MPNGQANITVLDGGLGIVSVPSVKNAPVIGDCSAGPFATPLAFSGAAGKRSLVSTFGVGRAVEAAAMIIDGGGTAIVARTAQTTTTANPTPVHVGTGTSAVTFSGAPKDDYLFKMKVITGGTIGTGPCAVQLSLDAGRTYGPVIQLGTGNSYAVPLPGTLGASGLTVAFGAGTLVTGDTFTAGFTAPTWVDADVNACLTALRNGPYTWGSPILVVGAAAAADPTAFETTLDEIAANKFKFSRMILCGRDASPAAAWNGTGETESAWMTSVETAYSAVDTVRVGVAMGHYNMVSSISGQRDRRSLGFAIAKRRAQVQASIHSGWVVQGALSPIAVDTTNDPQDGFIYHDEDAVKGLDAARFMTARQLADRQGFYCLNDNLMSHAGSDFIFLALGQVMDQFCSVLRQALIQYINGTIRIDPTTGFGLEKDLATIERTVLKKLQIVVQNGDASAVFFTLSRTDNVLSTRAVNYTTRVVSLGYIQEFDGTIAFANPVLAAA